MNKKRIIHCCIVLGMILVLSMSALAATINLRVEPRHINADGSTTPLSPNEISPGEDFLLNVYVPNDVSLFAATAVFRIGGEFQFVDDSSLISSGNIFSPLDLNKIVSEVWIMDGTTTEVGGVAVPITDGRNLLGQIKVHAPAAGGNLELTLDTAASEFWESRRRRHTATSSAVFTETIGVCTEECSERETQCLTAADFDYQVCGNYDADSCLEWEMDPFELSGENCLRLQLCDTGTNQCELVCGNGVLNEDAEEVCDDGGACSGDTDEPCISNRDCSVQGLGTCVAQSGDGCSNLCLIETGYRCDTPGQSCVPLDTDMDGVPDNSDICPSAPQVGIPVYPVGSPNAGCQLGDINANGCIDLPDWNLFLFSISNDFENNDYSGPEDLTGVNGLDLGDWNMFLYAMGEYFTTCQI